jgi:hypothetical protein
MGFGWGIRHMQDFLNGFIIILMWLIVTILLAVFFTNDEEENYKHFKKI